MFSLKITNFESQFDTIPIGRPDRPTIFCLISGTQVSGVIELPIGNLRFSNIQLTKEEQDEFNQLYGKVAKRIEKHINPENT